ncbi:hypothetical protein ACH495_30450 [Micromonospora sp. NPDC018662]|uniref:hypothetical protein n=1 Tax=Micromonospora sp. NPDC018662 TaxID=3364238 RepID=UPI0037B211C6
MTDLRLVVGAGVLAAAGVACAVLVWRRRPGVAVRAGVVLLAELLLVTAGALAVNRAEGFYPTWGALVQRSPVALRLHVTPGRLDATIRRTARGADRPVEEPWRPPSLAVWPQVETTVVVPAGYLRHPAWRYPAVLILSSPGDRWTDAQVLAAVGQPAPAVVVVAVRAAPDVDAGALAARLPQDLERDLRVTGHRWGLVASASVQRLAWEVVRRDPGRFPVLAIAGRSGPAEPARAVTVLPAPLPTGVSAVRVGPPGGPTAKGRDGVVDVLVAGLRWVGGQLPAPLAAPAPVLAPSGGPRPERHHLDGRRPPSHRSTAGIGPRRGA